MCRPNPEDHVLIKRATTLKALKGSNGIKPGTFIQVPDRTKALVEGKAQLKDSFIVLAELEHEGNAATLRASVDHQQIQAL